MSYHRNIFKSILPLCCIMMLFCSCGKDSDDEECQYFFGLTSAVNGVSTEAQTINLAYEDAYQLNGIKYSYGAGAFVVGTSKDLILQACRQAETAIQSSSVKFEGRYVYEVKSKKSVIYQQIYGIR